jgi:cyclohexa-1,5-dienecarbonyl-CoA hydratase
MSENKKLSVKIENRIARIEMVDAPANILGFDLMQELFQAVSQAESSNVLLLASGLKHFSTGVDIKIHTPDLVPKMLKEFHKIIRKLYHFPGITVCALQGYALGGGLELSLPCDFIFADRAATLGFPEIRLACYPPVASVLLPRWIGRKANALLFSGENISGEEAHRFGLVDSLFEAASRGEVVDAFVQKISSYSCDALRILKRLLRESIDFDFDIELDKAERYYVSELLQSPHVAEGIAAFLEKRAPRYK